MAEQKTRKVKISEVNLNVGQVKGLAKNPRLIRGEKFDKLVKSIKEFPEMLELRPIVVDENMVVLGGNMRLKACHEAGLTEIPILEAKNLTIEQKNEFLIKDNVGFGEWEWELISNEWKSEDLTDWGMDLWIQSTDLNELMEEELDLTEEFDPIGESAGLQRVVFIFDSKEDAAVYLTSNKIEYKKRNMAWQVNMTSKDVL